MLMAWFTYLIIFNVVTHICHLWINKYFIIVSFCTLFLAWFRFSYTLFLLTNCNSSPIFYYLFINFISLISNSESFPIFYFIWTYY
ncbi:hypothetical protein C1646_706320 [Rhizophagus diaphanus]|nr:hypothetical protein C1646_706320 [Rhizophagus diaphanus] [Rhizophagus sp. MUCL 43196]